MLLAVDWFGSRSLARENTAPAGRPDESIDRSIGVGLFCFLHLIEVAAGDDEVVRVLYGFSVTVSFVTFGCVLASGCVLRRGRGHGVLTLCS